MNLGADESQTEKLSLTIRCQLRSAPPRGFWRLLANLSLLGPLRSLGRALAAFGLGYRRLAELTCSGGQLNIIERTYVLGRELKTSHSRFATNSLIEVVLSSPKTDLVWLFGLVPLTLGTFLGFLLLGRGLVGGVGFEWFLGAAPLLMGLGLGLDLLLDAPRAQPAQEASSDATKRLARTEMARLLVVPPFSKGLLLVGPRSELEQLLEPWLSSPAPLTAISDAPTPPSDAPTPPSDAFPGAASGEPPARAPSP